MKAIMISIKPNWVIKILNGEKTIEVRRKFPKDFVGWVYIYCTKDQNEELWWYDKTEDFRLYKKGITDERYFGWHLQNGKVVARFWCDKVEEISYNYRSDFTSVYTDTLDTEDLEKQACLTRQEFAKYLKSDYGYAIHISKLEIFDKPKELNEFGKCELLGCCDYQKCNNCRHHIKLTKAPQSFCYVEVENNEF